MTELFIGLAIAGGLFVLTLVLPILSFLRAQEARRLAQSLGDRVQALEAAIARLSAGQRVERPLAPTATPAAAAPVRPAEDVRPLVAPAPVPARVEGPAAPRPVSVEPPAVAIPAAAAAAPAAAASSAAPAAPPAATPDDLEQRIGSRWLLYAGIAAVVLGMSYFVKFAFDNGWVSEPLRVAGGLAIGLGLVAAGMRFSARGLPLFGQALAGGGVLILYLAIYAALHFYRLVSEAPAFVLMALVTGAAAWLADKQRSQVLAMLALVGGFATPILVGGERDAQVVLFTYMAILIAGAALLARRHDWPLLAAGSYMCTLLLVMAWFGDSYDESRWLRTELFLTVYVVLFGFMLHVLLASKNRSPQALLSITLLATAPLAYHLASVGLLHAQPPAWLVYLVVVTVAGLAVAERAKSAWLRIAVLVFVGVPAFGWLIDLQYPAWLVLGMGITVALYALHLVAQWEATVETDDDTGLDTGQAIHTQLNGLLLPFTLYWVCEEHAPLWSTWAVSVPAVWNALVAVVARDRAPRMALQFTVLAATLTAATVVVAFDGPAVPAAWVAEGAFLGWLAMRERSRALGWGAGFLVLGGSLSMLGNLASPPELNQLPVFNPRALAALLVLGLLGWLAVRMQSDEAPEVRGGPRDAVIVLTNLLALVLVSAEIHGFFQQRAAGTEASLAEQLTLSVSWALYAVVLIAVGISRQYVPARYFAIALFGITVFKVLANDLAGLDRFYRMLTVLGVGVLLLVASYLYQRRSVGSSE